MDRLSHVERNGYERLVRRLVRDDWSSVVVKFTVGLFCGLGLAFAWALFIDIAAQSAPIRVSCSGETDLVDNTVEVQTAVRQAHNDCPFAARVYLPSCEIVTLP